MKIVSSLFVCALSIAPAFANDLPKFQVDASWPKTLPNNWIMGQAQAWPSTRRIVSGSFSGRAR
jgi:hypothetical protein